jgi:S1-C subfamily serine protease
MGLDIRIPARAFPGFSPVPGMPEFQGVMIDKIEPGSVAWQAKLAEGDVIVSVDGMDTPNWPTLVRVLKAHAPGDNVDITCIRKERDERGVVLDKAFQAHAVLPEKR